MGRPAQKVQLDEARGRRFQDARLSAGVRSMAAAARAAGLAEKTVQRWEHGKPVDAEAAKPLADVYGVRLGWLLYGDGPSPANVNPYPAWAQFLETPDAQEAPEWQVAQLSPIRFEPGYEPRVSDYQTILRLTRTGRPIPK